MKSLIIGKKGEDIAVQFLLPKGYKFIKRNFRIRGDEIDIISIHNNTLIYVEVKTRSNNKFGTAEESVGKRKINYLI